MANCTPISRDAMRNFKTEHDEEYRRLKLITIIETIYETAVNVAKTTTKTSYRYEIPSESFEFHTIHRNDILDSLKNLFPGCAVDHTMVNSLLGHDGKMYDVVNIASDILPFIRGLVSKEYIVIDWS